MKASVRSIFLFIIIYSVSWILPPKASAQVSINFQVFYDDLSPYGYWVDNPEYGYVWIPNVSRSFSPYNTDGYWVMTDEGWTWVSDYSWGWAPFHYGRWYYDRVYGYVWVPGNEWGPGWVTWRRSEGYYGWAPIGPGISIEIAYSSGYNVPYNQWTFIRNRDFGRRNSNNYYVNSNNNTTIIQNSTVINNYHGNTGGNRRYNRGPDRNEAEKHAGRIFAPVAVRENDRHGQTLNSNELRIYKPSVQENNNAGRRMAPAKVVNLKEVKPAAERNSVPRPQKENQPVREQPVQPKRDDQPVKPQPVREKRNEQPTKEQPVQPKRIDQPVKPQPVREKRIEQPTKDQPVQPKRVDQPVKPQPVREKRIEQPTREQPAQPKRNDQPVKPQPVQQNRNDQKSKQQPSQKQRENNPKKGTTSATTS